MVRSIAICLLLVACSSTPPPAVQTASGGGEERGSNPFARTPREPFQLVPIPDEGPEPPDQPGEPYSVLSADMEGDGDLDVLINWHNFGPLELYENVGGRLVLRSAPEADRSGLWENRGVPGLYAERDEQMATLAASDETGLWLWHDVDREAGSWRFFVRREAGLPLELELAANQPFDEVEGLSELEHVFADPQKLLVSIADVQEGREFRVRVEKISTQLLVRTSDPTLDVFVGPERVRVEAGGPDAGQVELWKPDPHGLAWMPPRAARDAPEPELYVCRGGLMGTLLPPNDPKFDRPYDFTSADGRLFAFQSERAFERSYGRSRQVEWVDVDRDGRPELYLGNRESRNTLGVFDPDSGAYADRAGERNVDPLRGETFGWVDFDDDGDDDLVFLGLDGLRARRNLGDGFTGADPKELGLDLIGVTLGDGDYLERPQILVADFDNDGALDLLVTTIGEELGIQLLARRGARFENVSVETHLLGQTGAAAVTTLDADNDGFLDILSVGSGHVTLLRNEGGRSFTPVRVPTPWPNELFGAVATTDVDGDGREDAVVVSHRRQLARNGFENENGFVRVDLTAGERLPVGAIVSAHYADGSVRAQRFGSANNPKFCPGLVPLHFGVSSTNSLETVSVRWPATGEVTVHPVGANDLGTTLRF